MSGITLHCSSILFIETRSLSQTQSSPVHIVLLAACFGHWSPSPCAFWGLNYRWAAIWDRNLGLDACVASALTAEPSPQPCILTPWRVSGWVSHSQRCFPSLLPTFPRLARSSRALDGIMDGITPMMPWLFLDLATCLHHSLLALFNETADTLWICGRTWPVRVMGASRSGLNQPYPECEHFSSLYFSFMARP